MNKYVLILLLLVQNMVAQEVVEYNKCEAYPQLKSKKDFVKEIANNVDLSEDIVNSYRESEISFYVDIDGNVINVKSSVVEIKKSIEDILKTLGGWSPGFKDDKKCITLIKFKLKW